MSIRIWVLALAIVGSTVDAQDTAQSSHHFDIKNTRLQLGGLDNKKIMAIVEVEGSDGLGTGFFGKNCTVWTNMHVLETELATNKKFLDEQVDPKDRTLVGRTFRYTTQKVNANGRFIEGQFEVVYHGRINQLNENSSSANDFAVGIDKECLSQKEDLGFFVIMTQEGFSKLEGSELFAAGFPFLEHSDLDGRQLVVDPKCRLLFEPQNDLWFTNCFSEHKGSGSPIGMKGLEHPLVKDKLFAYGMVVTGLVPDGPSPRDELVFGRGSAMIPFSAMFHDHPKLKEILETKRSPAT